MTAGLAHAGDHSGVVREQVAGAATRALRSTETAYVTLVWRAGALTRTERMRVSAIA
jgi:hypothetical protein